MEERNDPETHARELEASWSDDPRWAGVTRPYSARDVLRLRGSLAVEHTLARRGAQRLWSLLHERPFVAALGALTGNQAIQQVQAGLASIYLSGWQVAGDANLAGEMYPDLSLYPANSVPSVVARINHALRRADQIHHASRIPAAGSDATGNSTNATGNRHERETLDWFAPIVADAEAGFGGVLNAFELMKAMIEAGAAGVHFEDQLSSVKKCGHLGGKVLVPVKEFIQKLVAARLAADVADVPTLVIARTDADSASLLTSDVDERDWPFLTGKRTGEGFFEIKGGLSCATARAIAYAPFADLIWCETSQPDLEEARDFAEEVHRHWPGKLLAYNCSPSFNWKKHLDDATLARFQRELGAMGYKYQFVTLAGFHALNTSMFELARGYRDEGMAAYARLQEREFALEKSDGYRAVKHQSFVGTAYFDDVAQVVSGGACSTSALKGSTEEAQFHAPTRAAVNGALHASAPSLDGGANETQRGKRRPGKAA